MIRVRSITGLAAALTMLSAIYAFPGRAQDAPPSLPSASVNIHQVQIAFIGSGTAGGGTLYYRGRAYPFKLGGLGIGGFGVSRLDASGNVFNLRNPQDINGVYAQVRSGWVHSLLKGCGHGAHKSEPAARKLMVNDTLRRHTAAA